jgi:hypothetical protein
MALQMITNTATTADVACIEFECVDSHSQAGEIIPKRRETTNSVSITLLSLYSPNRC